MNTFETLIDILTTKIVKYFPYFLVLLGFLFAFIRLSEFYNVRLGGLESAYAFGSGDNAEDWLYQNSSHYSNYMLVIGLLFLTASIIALFGKLKRKKKLTIIGISMILFLLFINLII